MSDDKKRELPKLNRDYLDKLLKEAVEVANLSDIDEPDLVLPDENRTEKQSVRLVKMPKVLYLENHAKFQPKNFKPVTYPESSEPEWNTTMPPPAPYYTRKPDEE